jgi:hypothetical protein
VLKSFLPSFLPSLLNTSFFICGDHFFDLFVFGFMFDNSFEFGLFRPILCDL